MNTNTKTWSKSSFSFETRFYMRVYWDVLLEKFFGRSRNTRQQLSFNVKKDSTFQELLFSI